MMDMETIALVLLAPLLMATALCDLRMMRIPNLLPGLTVLLFLATLAWSLPLAEVLARSGVAALVLGLGFAAFALRMVGGGDVKSLSALMLFVPPQGLALFLLALSAALFLGIGALALARRGFGSPASSWAALRTKRFPMGISIALAGLALPLA